MFKHLLHATVAQVYGVIVLILTQHYSIVVGKLHLTI